MISKKLDNRYLRKKFSYFIWKVFKQKIPDVMKLINHYDFAKYCTWMLTWFKEYNCRNRNRISIKMKLFLKSAKNYLILIDSMMQKKYISQKGEKKNAIFDEKKCNLKKLILQILTKDRYFYHWTMMIFNQIDWYKQFKLE